MLYDSLVREAFQTNRRENFGPGQMLPFTTLNVIELNLVAFTLERLGAFCDIIVIVVIVGLRKHLLREDFQINKTVNADL